MSVLEKKRKGEEGRGRGKGRGGGRGFEGECSLRLQFAVGFVTCSWVVRGWAVVDLVDLVVGQLAASMELVIGNRLLLSLRSTDVAPTDQLASGLHRRAVAKSESDWPMAGIIT